MKLEMAHQRSARTPLSDLVREFTPNWFAVTMGTGAVALALNQVPLPLPRAYDVAGGLWLLDLVLFVLFTVLYAARWVFFFDGAQQIFCHSVVSSFLVQFRWGSPPSSTAFSSSASLSAEARRSPHVLWWTDVAMSVACGLLVPFFMFTIQDHSMERMTAVWLLPIVAAGVAAVSGALLVPHLSGAEAFTVLMLCYALWAFSVPSAMSMLVILLLRLVLHKLPDREMAASGWLALGPIGTGALALLLLGGDAPAVFAVAGLSGVGDVAFGVGVVGGRALWGYGVWWLLLAILKTARYFRERMPFNLGWWGFIFPLGTYSLAHATHLVLFSVVGSILVICVSALWFIVAVLTVDAAWHGYRSDG
jgi:C4-dicarboxylate transporter/malic acid transport protein